MVRVAGRNCCFRTRGRRACSGQSAVLQDWWSVSRARQKMAYTEVANHVRSELTKTRAASAMAHTKNKRLQRLSRWRHLTNIAVGLCARHDCSPNDACRTSLTQIVAPVLFCMLSFLLSRIPAVQASLPEHRAQKAAHRLTAWLDRNEPALRAALEMPGEDLPGTSKHLFSARLRQNASLALLHLSKSQSAYDFVYLKRNCTNAILMEFIHVYLDESGCMLADDKIRLVAAYKHRHTSHGRRGHTRHRRLGGISRSCQQVCHRGHGRFIWCSTLTRGNDRVRARTSGMSLFWCCGCAAHVPGCRAFDAAGARLLSLHCSGALLPSAKTIDAASSSLIAHNQEFMRVFVCRSA